MKQIDSEKKIIETVERICRIENITASSRKIEYIKARCIAAFALQQKAFSINQIGKILQRGRFTVSNAQKQHENFVSTNDKDYIGKLEQVCQTLNWGEQ